MPGFDGCFQIGQGIEALEAGAMDQGVEDGRVAATADGAHEEVVLATDGDGSLDILGAIVVDWPVAGIGIAYQFWPLVTGIHHRLAQG